MAEQDPQSLSQYSHYATAFGVAGQINRPAQQRIPIQASVTLPITGGHDADRVDNYKAPGFVSFTSAYVDVGGSLDSGNNTHTTYASSVIEGLNIFNVITADRVVSRLTVYHSASLNSKARETEPSFSIAGSHFDNLRIAGQQINIQLDPQICCDSTYTNFCDGNGGADRPQRKSLIGINLDSGKLAESDHNYAIVKHISDWFKEWDRKNNQPIDDGSHFWCSAANYLVSPPPAVKPNGKKKKEAPRNGLTNFGGIICVPRFGVVYLAELHIYRNHRNLTMIRVHMCSPGDGSITGGGTGGGGSSTPPG